MAGKKILVADDSLTIQKVIRLALSNEGYDIQAVSDGNDAIQQISLFRPNVVLIDVSLPGKTAFEVKKVVNDQSDMAGVRFVLMSSAFETVDESLASQVKFHARLTKPFDPAHLRQLLTGVLSAPELPRSEKMGTGFESAPDFAPEPQLDTLWDRGDRMAEKGEDPFAGLTPPPLKVSLPPIAPPSSLPPESDIRELTESTIRMSKLDDFQWSIQEPNGNGPGPSVVGDRTLTNLVLREPTLKPTNSMSDLGGTSFELNPAVEELGPIPFVKTGSKMPDGLASYYGASLEQESDEMSLTSPRLQPPSVTPPPPPPPPPMGVFGGGRSESAPETETLPLSAAQIEDLLRKQLQETIEKMAARILPEVAEKVIKQEIHRMLQDPV